MSLLATLLLAVATAASPTSPEVERPDFSLSLGGPVIPIYCSRNEAELTSVQNELITVVNEMAPLYQARMDNMLSEADNEKLFLLGLIKADREITISLRYYARYYCDHKDKIPKIEASLGDSART